MTYRESEPTKKTQVGRCVPSQRQASRNETNVFLGPVCIKSEAWSTTCI